VSDVSTPFRPWQQVFGGSSFGPSGRINSFTSVLSSVFSSLTVPPSGGLPPSKPNDFYFARVSFYRGHYTDQRPLHGGLVYYTNMFTITYADGRSVDYFVQQDGTIRDGQGKPPPFKIKIPPPSSQKFPPGYSQSMYIDKQPGDYTGPPVKVHPLPTNSEINKAISAQKQNKNGKNQNTNKFDHFDKSQTTMKTSSPSNPNQDFRLAPALSRR